MNRILNQTASIALVVLGLAVVGCEQESTPKTSPPPRQFPTGPVEATPETPAAPEQPATPAPETPTPPNETDVHPAPAPPAEPHAAVPTPPPVPDGKPNLKVPSDPKVAVMGNLSGPKPVTWIWHPTQRQSAIAEYAVPGRDGADQARLTVFRVGGKPEDNITRWKLQQFRNADQSVVEPKLDQLEVEGMKVHLAEFNGEYKGPGAVNFSPNYTLLAAIIPDAPGGQIIIYFVGPAATIDPNRQPFMELIRNLKKSEPEK